MSPTGARLSELPVLLVNQSLLLKVKSIILDKQVKPLLSTKLKWQATVAVSHLVSCKALLNLEPKETKKQQERKLCRIKLKKKQ